MTSLVQWCILSHGIGRRLVLMVSYQTLVSSMPAQFAVSDTTRRWRKSTAFRCHEHRTRRRLFLFNALVVFNLTILLTASSVARDRYRRQIVLTEVARHALVLLRGHVPAHSPDVIEGALLGARTTTEIAAGLPNRAKVIDGVALVGLRSAVSISLVVPGWLGAETTYVLRRPTFVAIDLLLGDHVLLAAALTLLAGLGALLAGCTRSLDIKHLLS